MSVRGIGRIVNQNTTWQILVRNLSGVVGQVLQGQSDHFGRETLLCLGLCRPS